MAPKKNNTIKEKNSTNQKKKKVKNNLWDQVIDYYLESVLGDDFDSEDKKKTHTYLNALYDGYDIDTATKLAGYTKEEAKAITKTFYMILIFYVWTKIEKKIGSSEFKKLDLTLGKKNVTHLDIIENLIYIYKALM